MFAYYLFFGKITIDVNKIRSQSFRDFIFDTAKNNYKPIIDSINNILTEKIYFFSDMVIDKRPNLKDILSNIPNELVTSSDLDSSINESIGFFMSDIDVIKNLIDNGLAEYENFAKGVILFMRK